MSPSPSRGLIVAAFAAVYLIWGSTYLAIRVAIETLPPFLMAGLRFVTAGGLLYLWASRAGAPTPSPRQWFSAAIVGGLLLLGGNGLLCWSEQWVPSGLAALLIATVPLWMMLERWALEGVRPAASALLGLALGMSGLVILVGPSLVGQGGADPLGVGLILIGALCWATGSVLSRRLQLPPNALMATAAEMLTGGAMQLVVGALGGEAARLHIGSFTTTTIAALAYLTLFGSLMGYTAYVWLLGVASPAAVSTYAFVNPIVAMFLGWLILGEQLTARMLVATAVTLVGVAFITASTLPKTERVVRETLEVPE